MKKIYNYTFQLVCIYILILSVFSISNVELDIENYESNIHNVNNEKAIDSTLLAVDEHIEANKDESINVIEESNDTSIKLNQDEVTQNTTKKEQKENSVVQEVEQTTKPQETIDIVDTSSYPVLSTETVTISHYGHDCYGCTSGYTAGGYYVGDGRIYYQDKVFGSVRVIAADRKYPLGSIVRLQYLGSSMIAIVLDYGGGIGDGKKFQIDLLESSEKEANSKQVIYNSQLEVLRLGY